MITKEQVLEYFRGDSLEDLEAEDRYEIMVACCSQSDFLEVLINKAIDDEEKRLRENY